MAASRATWKPSFGTQDWTAATVVDVFGDMIQSS